MNVASHYFQQESIHEPPSVRVGQWINFTYLSSRWCAFFNRDWTNFYFPKQILLTEEGIKTNRVRKLSIPWRREIEMMPYNRVSSIRHMRGFLWDSIIIESSGGNNNLDIDGLKKAEAEVLVAAINRTL